VLDEVFAWFDCNLCRLAYAQMSQIQCEGGRCMKSLDHKQLCVYVDVVGGSALDRDDKASHRNQIRGEIGRQDRKERTHASRGDPTRGSQGPERWANTWISLETMH